MHGLTFLKNIESYWKANKKKLCHSITPELQGFRRPNWAQIEAELCVSDLGVFFLFDYRSTGWQRSDVVVGYTSHTIKEI